MAEKECGQVHGTIQEAIRHARLNLGAKPEDGGEWLDSEPVWGRLSSVNLYHVIGWQISSRQRWRLDYSPSQGVHVNEEDFTGHFVNSKVIHRIDSRLATEDMVRLMWRKWTSRFTRPGIGDP